MVTTSRTSTSSRRIDTALLLVRVVLGLVFVGHGAQKLFGAFGGGGLEGTAQFMEEVAGLSPGKPFAVVSGVVEFGGGLLLLAGLLTTVAGLAIAANMVGAIVTVVGTGAFFAQNGGLEFELTLTVAAFALAVAGPGRLSLDHKLGTDIVERTLRSRARAVAS